MNWLGSLGPASIPKAIVQSVPVASVGTESDEGEAQLKSQQKCENKFSAQSSQIKDLHSKLD